ncbi:hypothetical protein CPJCM30710_11150 [Clostridium polyendosporum]|uniref:Uncharacterized protein n=1 Tax=Clostridium polyendosporum TaxID=69208 RepID=A0A919RY70_9CLOT|nr:hypothetical protein [Clostridium polyendosporum]GIM28449.1 hypothetical protein CPJCM30710_11150 [Clostridium polyendosporum]
MLIRRKISKDEIINLTKKDAWNFGNQVLYDMCSNNPEHKDKKIIIGKVWLIGRAYAAAIERRKNVSETGDGDDFYFKVVAPKIKEIGGELDRRIKALNKCGEITEDNLIQILDTHKFLTDIYYEITKLNKRSLASKYLHFHAPNKFYIYDSRADESIRKYISLDRSMKEKLKHIEADENYLEFVIRMFTFQNYIKEKYDIYLTPRQIDVFLLKY